jgi:hypothetical protein
MLAAYQSSALVSRAAGPLAHDAVVGPLGVPLRIAFDETADDAAGAAGAADGDAEVAIRASPAVIECLS